MSQTNQQSGKGYRKKPGSTVTARQWWPPGDSRFDPSLVSCLTAAGPVVPEVWACGGSSADFYAINADAKFNIVTREGQLNVSPGDWIVSDGVSFWPVKPDYFDKHYEEVSAPTNQQSAQHTPEPWFWRHQDWRGNHGGDRLYISGNPQADRESESVCETGIAIVEGNQTSHGVTTANATRIVACVNTLQGIPDPAEFRRQAESALRERDEARRVLKMAYPHLRDMVARGQVQGEDTSHYTDAQALKAIEAILDQSGGGQ